MTLKQSTVALLAMTALSLAIAPPAGAQTVPASAKGSYISDQQSGTFTGTSSFYKAGDTFNDFTTEFRSYFVFNIPSLGVGETFTGATLRIQAPPGSYNSGAPTETYTLFNFALNNATITILAANTGGQTAFNDLGSGTSYGSIVLSSATNGTIVDIGLNGSALGDINTRAGQTLAIGGAVTTLTSQELVFDTSTPSNTVELVLTRSGGAAAAPEPTTGLLALAGMVMMVTRRRRG